MSTTKNVMISNLTPVHRKSTWCYYVELTRLHLFSEGITFLFYPCAWALTMVAYRTNLPPRALAIQILLFALRTTFLHSAECVINDICDVNFDRQVERTKNRPLAAGHVSIPEAWILFSALMGPSVSLLFQMNPTAIAWAMFGIPLLALYPLMKRWIWWPQAWLGIAMNWGFPVAWISVIGVPTRDVLLPCAAGLLCWTIVYDTIYACQDRKYDAKAGVKSTALIFGSWVRLILMCFASVFVTCLVYAGKANDQGPAYFYLSCGGAALHFVWQFATWEVDVTESCFKVFLSNNYIGIIVWSGMLLDYYMKIVGPVH